MTQFTFSLLTKCRKVVVNYKKNKKMISILNSLQCNQKNQPSHSLCTLQTFFEYKHLSPQKSKINQKLFIDHKSFTTYKSLGGLKGTYTHTPLLIFEQVLTIIFKSHKIMMVTCVYHNFTNAILSNNEKTLKTLCYYCYFYYKNLIH